jgi:hypothetical protein
VDGFTPDAKRVSMTGMFEIIGSPRPCACRSVAEETDVVSSSGTDATTFTFSLIWPSSSVNGIESCWPTARTMPRWVKRLKPVISTDTS